ncbi:uncharacterized protein SCHCODRAFT_02107619 [Schizophyllum commune H4-8]|uniref:uncharacterized protein n=1 Tax=Schizophyllum commune (strain H4-8 / FGSC 9210) TaxID=578458 RepID=UPI002160C5A9|nr:uncharacterized protein SCHCODRAFT_02107619 [Schizophyllum commune H4-8]KAI5885892.1 hypothetical protein SCHCODRAFT_02107619 [Schizophyllum commune H4-8]
MTVPGCETHGAPAGLLMHRSFRGASSTLQQREDDGHWNYTWAVRLRGVVAAPSTSARSLTRFELISACRSSASQTNERYGSTVKRPCSRQDDGSEQERDFQKLNQRDCSPIGAHVGRHVTVPPYHQPP